jgi:hypothetical protein
MFKNWSKIVLVSLLVVAIAAPAFGTTARVRSMANTGNYLSDDSNVFRWYSTLPSYANMVQAEIGTWGELDDLDVSYSLSDTRALGFNYACGEDGKWGTYRLSLLENAVDHPGFYLVNQFILGHALDNGADDLADPWDSTPVNKWDLAGGWEIGESIVLGVAYTRSSWKAEDLMNRGTAADPNSKQSLSWTTFGVGFTWTNNEDFLLDATFTYATGGGESEITPAPAAGTSKIEWDKSGGFEVGARLFWDWKDYVTVVPLFQYMTSEYALTRTATPANPYAPGNGDKNADIIIGAALDLEVNGSNTLIFAAEYNWNKWEYSVADTASAPAPDPHQRPVQEYTTSVFPTFRLALESEITSWLTTRVGAVHRNISYKQTRAGKEMTWTNGEDASFSVNDEPNLPDDFDWFLGVGFNVAEWTIDMELHEATPFAMGYWLTGYSPWGFSEGSQGPVTRISGTYNF